MDLYIELLKKDTLREPLVPMPVRPAPSLSIISEKNTLLKRNTIYIILFKLGYIHLSKGIEQN